MGVVGVVLAREDGYTTFSLVRTFSIVVVLLLLWTRPFCVRVLGSYPSTRVPAHQSSSPYLVSAGEG
jgi:hypothetical protein